jgi:5'-methylthioadenosine phosphorylase
MDTTESIARLALIGGTGVGQFALEGTPEPRTITTPWGDAAVTLGRLRGRDVVFLARHGSGHSVPPHRINFRANIRALQQLGVRAALATTAVGGLRPDLAPGTMLLLDNFIDFCLTRTGKTFHDDRPVHTDFTTPYAPEARQLVLDAAAHLSLPLVPTGTYVCCDGPRYETPAEVRLFASWGGDVVGMTGVPEVTLAREAGIAYAGISLVTNPGAGISPTPLTHTEVEEAMQAALPKLRTLLTEAVSRWKPA